MNMAPLGKYDRRISIIFFIGNIEMSIRKKKTLLNRSVNSLAIISVLILLGPKK